MAKVLLLKASYDELYADFKKGARLQALGPPLGLLYLGAGLEKEGHEVEIVDAELEKYNYQDFTRIIEKTDADIIGVGSTTPEVTNVSKLLDLAKQLRPDITTVLGGPHVTILPQDAGKVKGADYLVSGEAEFRFPKLVTAIEKEEVPKMRGTAYRKGENMKFNPREELIGDLNSIPQPAYHLIDSRKYLWPTRNRGLVPAASLISTRGCPYQCIFCNKMYGGQVRFRSPENVMSEIEEIYHGQKIKFLNIYDEVFILDKQRATKICDMIIESGMDLRWFGFVRANLVSKEMLKKMADAGCVRITMGVESGNQKILDVLQKQTTLDQYRKAYKWAKELGLETRASFIIGSPHETRKTIRDTINFAKELPLDEAYFNIMTPYPGTKVKEMAEKGDGISLITDDWAEYCRWGNAVVELKDISREQLIKLQKRALFEFYIRPKTLWYHFRRMGLKDGLKVFISHVPTLMRLLKARLTT